ncbi:hypothetical protein N7540_001920 [Penicillium herquei]|nr:hypothetical protein N7540_001920 [Penicillium herquei]
MSGELESRGRPYRSHLHPACFACKKRKSRCKTRSHAEACIMCQAHGTECIFPRADNGYIPRKLPVNASSRIAKNSTSVPRNRHGPTTPQLIPDPAECGDDFIEIDHSQTQAACVQQDFSLIPSRGTDHQNERAEGLPHLAGIVPEAEDHSSHIVSPAIADDNEILESYLSAIPAARRHLSRIGPSSMRSIRPVRFNVVPRRPLGVNANQSLAAGKCEVIEKYIDPDIDEYLDLFFQKANPCFPIFDEALFRSTYSSEKGRMSPALLCSLYANSLVYWKSSPRLRSGRAPDIRFIWNQASEALHSELFLSPGISTVMSIILNVCGRPSTSMFGNGGMVGTAVALSNALGLNRDPSGWSISPLERSLRIRIWWLVVVHDRWCSLAYGTPLQVHRSQYDVPLPSVADLCQASVSSYEREAASIFVAFVSLTDVLARYLEYVYCVSKDSNTSQLSATSLEHLINDWEESLDDDIRLLVLQGTNLGGPGAANLRLGYLAIKLLLRRIQLDLNKSAIQAEDHVPLFYMQAQRAAEDIAHLIQELDEPQLRGFWIPVHSFSINSAMMFLLRSGLRMRHLNRNTPLRIARDMISALRAHSQNFGWDLADNCLAHCSDLVEMIAMNNPQVNADQSMSEFPYFSDELEIDLSGLDDLLLGITGFSDGFNL